MYISLVSARHAYTHARHKFPKAKQIAVFREPRAQYMCPKFVISAMNGSPWLATGPHSVTKKRTASRSLLNTSPLQVRFRPWRALKIPIQKIKRKVKHPLSHPDSWSYSYLARSETLSLNWKNMQSLILAQRSFRILDFTRL